MGPGLKNRTTVADMYKTNKYYTQPKSVHHVSEYKLYKAIMSDLFKGIASMIIEDGFKYKIPHGLGYIYIKAFKPKRHQRAVDYQLSKLYNKVIYHTNEHSAGLAGRWKWDKRDTLAKGVSLYIFHATRANTRALAKAIKERDTIREYTF